MKHKFLLTGLMLLLGLTVSAQENGTCGENITWTLEDGTLTISGTGEMPNYGSYTSVPWYSFHSSITSVTIADGVTSIGDYAFGSCSSLTSVTLGNSVTSIGECAFSICSSLTSVTIPNSVTSIGRSAFEYCSSLTSVTIPNSVTSIGSDAFNNVPNIVYNGSATGSPWGARSVNGYVDGYLVYSDASKTTLLACSAAATGEIVIPNSVTSIGEDAFDGCYNLTYVTIPNSVKSIEDMAFLGCRSLTSVTIPNSVTSIGEWAFAYCSSLTSVTIGNSVTSIGGWAFCACSSLISIIVDEANSDYCDIDGVLFSKDKKTLVQFPAGKGTSYTIPNNVTSIGKYAFSGCSSLTSITITNSVTSIGISAFGNCSSLTSVTIPESVTSIGSEAFYRCSSLTSVTIPNSVTSIGNGAFFGCSSLTSITITNSVTGIGDMAFYVCSSLTSVTIGNSVTSIGKYAFDGCSSLTSVTCEAVNPPVCGDDVFYDVDKSIPLYVPANSMEAYKEAKGWKDFKENTKPISAEGAELPEDKVQTEASENGVVIEWPASTGADTYTITISCKEAVICVLTFDAEGRLLDISINIPHIAARDRRNAEAALQTVKGWQYTIKGLNAGTTYNYTVTTKDRNGNALDTKTGEFTTEGATAIEEVYGENGKNGYSGRDGSAVKVMRDGVTYIVMPDGRMYDLQGKEVEYRK